MTLEQVQARLAEIEAMMLANGMSQPMAHLVLAAAGAISAARLSWNQNTGGVMFHGDGPVEALRSAADWVAAQCREAAMAAEG